MKCSVTRLCQSNDYDYYLVMIFPQNMLCHKFMYIHATGVYSLGE